MDIDAFNQCLIYMQHTASDKPSFDAYIGVFGTLAGTGLGFWLNNRFTSKKEQRVEEVKKACCIGDLQELLNTCEHSSKETSILAAELATKTRPRSHRLPSNVKLSLLDRMYPDIVGSFSSDQQLWIKLILRYIEDINEGLRAINESAAEKSLFKISKTLVNLRTSLYDVFKLTLWVLENKQTDLPDADQMLLQVGAKHYSIIAFRTLELNIEREDEVLGLDK